MADVLDLNYAYAFKVGISNTFKVLFLSKKNVNMLLKILGSLKKKFIDK